VELDAACHGLAAALLGVCLISANKRTQDPGMEKEDGMSPQMLLDIISSRIGLAAFFSLLNALKQQHNVLKEEHNESNSGADAPLAAGTL
jgi:hypothetical protein